MQERVLGDVYQQMVADRVPDPYIQFCGRLPTCGSSRARRRRSGTGRPVAARKHRAGEPSGAPASGRKTVRTGRRDAASGLYEWYDYPEEVRQEQDADRVSWADILSRWALVEADLHDVYGVDVEDRALLRTRSWRWLDVRISGLLAADTRLHGRSRPSRDAGQ
ncbi:hypothetical protein GA0074692_6710 [Micromonospora pallida]|uniref:DUF7426 domain-containing protein n=1 Tax=Micromonospora pallida TaxID=145854 RepID=A0A1C6TKQ4_9ACTN|nr:hypothetical protein GA0074692_6710 [Micromonospora pallida]